MENPLRPTNVEPKALEMFERVLEVLEMHIDTCPDSHDFEKSDVTPTDAACVQCGELQNHPEHKMREFEALAALRKDLIERIMEIPEGAWDDRPDWKMDESFLCPHGLEFGLCKHDCGGAE